MLCRLLAESKYQLLLTQMCILHTTQPNTRQDVGKMMVGLLRGLDLKPAPQEKIYVWFCDPGKKPMGWEDTGIRREELSIVLFNGYIVLIKLPFKCLCLWAKVRVFANLVREVSFSSEQKAITGKCTRESDCWMFSHKGDICTTLSKNERTIWKREWKKGGKRTGML